MPPNTLKVDRATRWGNPFNATQGYIYHQGGALVKLHEPASLARCLDLYSAMLVGITLVDPLFLEPLRGKNLACWCKPDALCHADVLLRLANEWRHEVQHRGLAA